MAAVRAEVEPATAFSASFGTVMVVHTGPGLAGLAWWWTRSHGADIRFAGEPLDFARLTRVDQPVVENSNRRNAQQRAVD